MICEYLYNNNKECVCNLKEKQAPWIIYLSLELYKNLGYSHLKQKHYLYYCHSAHFPNAAASR